MSSKVLSSGESPPWIQKNCLFMTAARGSEQNEFMQASYKRSEYFRLPARDSDQKIHNERERGDLHSSLKVK